MWKISCLLVLLLAVSALSGQIQSTAVGGYWSDPGTWVYGVVPGSGDTVSINGTVYVPNGVSCRSMFVQGSGVLMNNQGEQSTIYVSETLINLGLIEDYQWGYNPGNLQIKVFQNLINSGICTNNAFWLNGTSDQHLANGGNFSPGSLIDENPDSALILDSDLVVTRTNILMNNAQLILNSGAAHNIIGYGQNGQGSLRGAQIVGGYGAYISCNNGFWLENNNADEIVLQGNVQITGSLTAVHLTNYASIFNPAYGSASLNVSSELINYGTIKNHDTGGTLYLSLSGELYDYGSLANYQLNFAGNTGHMIWQDASAPAISCQNITASSTESGILLLSNLRFTGSVIDLSGGYIVLFDNGNTYGITQTGGCIRNTRFIGRADSYMTLSALYLQNINADMVVLNGNLELRDTNTFGELKNNATLRNSAYQNSTLNVNQMLENHGAISNNEAGGYLYLNIYGDIYNYNVINNYRTDLAGSSTHLLWQNADTTVFSGTYLYSSSSAGEIQLLSDFRFSGCRIDLGGNTIQMYDGSQSQDIYISGGYLANAVLVGGTASNLTMNSAYMQDISANRLILNGYFEVKNSVSIGTLVNNATIQNVAYNDGTISISQKLENYGTLRTHEAGGSLYLEISGNLYNYATIVPRRVLINGSIDQYVRNAGNLSPAQGMQLVSEIGAAQWYFDSSLYYSGYVTNYTVSPNTLGVWQPFNGTSFGRHITIGSGTLLAAPANVLIEQEGTSLQMRWDQVSGANFYTVYACSSPSGTYTYLSHYVFDNDTGDGFVYLALDPSIKLKFFKVTASN